MYNFTDPRSIIDPETIVNKDEKIVFIKVISQPVWNNHTSSLTKVMSIGDITWVYESNWWKDTIHPEDNKHRINFKKECFEVTECPEEYKDISHTISQKIIK